MVKARSTKGKKRRFWGNQHSSKKLDANVSTASSSKLLDTDNVSTEKESFEDIKGNRIIDIGTLISIISILCCPDCLAPGLKLTEDSRYGLCSNFAVKCHCGFITGFTSTPKTTKASSLNVLVVLGLRLIGRGFNAGKMLRMTLNLPYLTKTTFRSNESKLYEAVEFVAEENMKISSKEVKNKNKRGSCGVSIDGTWQKRGHMSLNGCVSAISIDSGKVLDIEAISLHCKMCETKGNIKHLCSKYKGSSCNMEAVGAYRIFERSVQNRDLQYTEYYGDGDSKAFQQVKDVYGTDTVTKLECIGHIQKRVGSRLRKLKKQTKGLGGKGKLTDKFIDKLQNYYGIAIRSNVGNLKGMQSAVIAAFYHSCSSNQNPMHGQCPTGPESWCKFQRALDAGTELTEKSPGLPDSVINKIKPIYQQLCLQELLKKCLHGKTQNNNESFNNVLWNILPKENFVQYRTLLLGAKLAVLLFNSGFIGLMPIFKYLQMKIEPEMIKNYSEIDSERIKKSRRQIQLDTKLSRKIIKAKRKSKLVKNELKEGVTYKYGGF